MRQLLTYLSILWGFATFAQNLVPNGSFESHTTCPSNGGEITLATNWFQPHIWGSSTDLFDSCGNLGYSVPYNAAGFQMARTGGAYAGIMVFDTFGSSNTREYLEVKLTDTLEAGKKYCMEFYVSLADTAGYGITSFGVYFSSDSLLYYSNYVNDPACYNNPFTNVISCPTQVSHTGGAIIDKQNWIKVSGEIIANGNECFITIGNFQFDGNTGYIHVGNNPNNPYDVISYYYIDDVSVFCCEPSGSCIDSSSTESSITIPNVFTPNGDGINDVFTIESTAIENMSCEIFNRWGIKVATLSRLNEGWDGRTTSGQEAIEGVYYYVVTAKGTDSKEHRKTGFIQLLR